jgi:STE24 endopeptidase
MPSIIALPATIRSDDSREMPNRQQSDLAIQAVGVLPIQVNRPMIRDMLMVVLGVLSLVLAFPSPIVHWVSTPWMVWSMVMVVTLLPGLAGWYFQRLVLRKLNSAPEYPGDAHYLYIRCLQFTQWGMGAIHAALLLATPWQIITRRLPMIGDWLLMPSTIAILPFLISVVLVWIAFYPAERAIKEVALEVHLMRGKPVRAISELTGYVLNNLRHQVLFILIPMLLIMLARDLINDYARQIDRFARGYDALKDVLLGSAALMIALITPEILRHVWVTQRLPVGALRDRLLILSKQIGVRCREILVWKAGGSIVNAAVMGVIAPLRYVLITEAMLEQLDDRRIEAVYGHEAGHVKRWHILYLLLFAGISGSLLTVYSLHTRGDMTSLNNQIIAAIVGGVLLAKWMVMFGWISRHFERQADIYGVRTLMLTGLECHTPCRVHGNPIIEMNPREVLAKDAPLCQTAAEYYSATLDQVAILNGIPPEANSWRHGSIADRGRRVVALASDPQSLRRFEARVLRIKIVLAVVSLTSLTWAAIELRIWMLGWFILQAITGQPEVSS